MTTEHSQPRPLTLERMRLDIAAILGESPDQLENDDNLLDWGLDSMRIFNLSVEWNKTGLELRFADLAETPTLDGWWQQVQRQQSGV
ncbi:phosphopantetheine-binding protein [Oceanimonas baumannii]|uniref:phosphopantetheine-binding protein n=1 Tax=Oceanimonas baumannii TaxID=129578 RepID=UPI003A8C90DB